MFEVELQTILVILLGFGAGSFINVVIFRYNTNEPIFSGRSRCLACGKSLRWHELMPVLSFLMQKGRCRNCRSKISRQYPAVELLTGFLFLFFYLKGGFPAVFWWFLVGGFLILLALYDLRHKILPDRFTYAFAATAFFGNVVFNGFNLANILLSLLPALFLFLLWLFSRGRWMGLGDAKLAAGGGFFLGWPQILPALFLSFWVGAAAGLFLILTNQKITLKSEIPFGPFLALGILIAFFLPELWPGKLI